MTDWCGYHKVFTEYLCNLPKKKSCQPPKNTLSYSHCKIYRKKYVYTFSGGKYGTGELIELLCEQLDIEADEVNENTDIVNDLGADSLDVVDLVMTLEDEFDIEIPDEDIEKIHTVGELAHYLEEHIDS